MAIVFDTVDTWSNEKYMMQNEHEGRIVVRVTPLANTEKQLNTG